MNNILVWTKNGILKAAQISEVPRAFTFDGRWFGQCKFNPGDVDYLRNEKGKLTGFCYLLDDREKKDRITECIVAQSSQCYIEDDFLFIFLRACQKFEIQVVQAIGTFLYYDEADSVILIIPNWEMGALAFDLTTDDVPVPCNL